MGQGQRHVSVTKYTFAGGLRSTERQPCFTTVPGHSQICFKEQ